MVLTVEPFLSMALSCQSRPRAEYCRYCFLHAAAVYELACGSRISYRYYELACKLAVYILAVTDFQHDNYECFARDAVQNSISPNSDTKYLFVSGELP